MPQAFNALAALWVGVAGALALTLSGCGDLIPPRPPIGSPTDADQAAAAEVPSELQTALVPQPLSGSFEGEWEAWYVHRLGSQIVGITEIRAEPVIDSSLLTATDPGELRDPDVKYMRRERLVFRTGQTQFTRRISTESVETAEGVMKSFQNEVQTGPMLRTTRGTGNGKRVTVVTNRGGTQDRSVLPWSEANRGLFAIEQSLRREGMEAGQIRRLEVLLPTADAMGLVELSCLGQASIAMIDGQYRTLMEAEALTYQDGDLIDSAVIWFDDDGVIEKTLQPGLRLEAFRTSKSEAMKRFDQRGDSDVLVAVRGDLGDSAEPDQVAFVVKSLSENPKTGEEAEPSEEAESAKSASINVPAVANQLVRQTDQGVQVLVTGESPSREGFRRDQSQPSDADTAATGLIDHSNPIVRRTATTIGDLPPEELFSELVMRIANAFSLTQWQGWRPASTLIRRREGSPIDHAVASAAVLRARDIPARLVFGLVPAHSDRLTRGDRVVMRLTAWVIAYVDNQWVSIDPMTGKQNATTRLALRVPSGDADLASEYVATFQDLSKSAIEIAGVK